MIELNIQAETKLLKMKSFCKNIKMKRFALREVHKILQSLMLTITVQEKKPEGGGDGWSRGEWWEVNVDNCT